MHVWRNHFLSDAFNKIGSGLDQLPGFFVSFEDGAIRIRADDSDMRILLFQETPRARDSAARSQSGDEVRDLAFCLFPDFWARRAIVRFGISGMRILIWIEGVGCFGR